jgi:hypothetical protein
MAHNMQTDDGYKLSAATHIHTSTQIIHRQRRLWVADADEFKPERWLVMVDGMLRQNIVCTANITVLSTRYKFVGKFVHLQVQLMFWEIFVA